jgi:hypothetical protein
MATILPCPRCVQSVRVSEEDPDGSLSDLWDHLGVHEPYEEPRTELFIRSQWNARTTAVLSKRPTED